MQRHTTLQNADKVSTLWWRLSSLFMKTPVFFVLSKDYVYLMKPSIYLMKPSQNSLTASYVRPCIFWRLWKMKMELKCTLKYLIISFCFVQVDWLTHKRRQAWLSRRGDGPSHKVGAKITLKPKKWLHITYINITWCSKSICTIENFVH